MTKRDMLLKEIAKRILAARRAIGWSQAQLAMRLRIDPGTLSRYESGVLIPPLDVLLQICELLGIPFDHITTATVDKLNQLTKAQRTDPPARSLSEEEAEMLRIWLQLRPRDRSLIVDFCRSMLSRYGSHEPQSTPAPTRKRNGGSSGGSAPKASRGRGTA